MCDFFIIGAQKAGTTALAAILANLDGICMALPKEPMLFCYDDADVHLPELLHPQEKWSQYRWERDKETLLTEYKGCFDHHRDGDLRGEASTTYAASSLAASRIAQEYPNAKIIFIIRNPIDRAVSAYWHAVRIGALQQPFDQVLQLGANPLLHFGNYEEQIMRYREFFSEEDILVLHYDEFTKKPLEFTKKTLRFLRQDSDELTQEMVTQRENESFYPRSMKIHAWVANIARLLGRKPKVTTLNLKASPEEPITKKSIPIALYKKIFMTQKRPNTLSKDNRRRLEEYFYRKNAKLPELLNEDIFTRWGWKINK